VEAQLPPWNVDPDAMALWLPLNLLTNRGKYNWRRQKRIRRLPRARGGAPKRVAKSEGGDNGLRGTAHDRKRIFSKRFSTAATNPSLFAGQTGGPPAWGWPIQPRRFVELPRRPAIELTARFWAKAAPSAWILPRPPVMAFASLIHRRHEIATHRGPLGPYAP